MRLPSVVAFFVILISAAAPITPVAAHPGGLNADGCHNNRKTGGYHCHRGGSSPARVPNALGVLSRDQAVYQNCSAARAAGAAPILAGQPGYSRKLDRDGDGIACE